MTAHPPQPARPPQRAQPAQPPQPAAAHAPQRVVVVGAGYAGVAAAARAGRRHHVTLIAPETRFPHRVRQYETAAGRPEHRPDVATLLRGRRVHQLRARVTELDLAGRKLLLDSGAAVPYDRLVYAVGARTAFHGVPGAAEFSFPVERAAELAERVRDAARPGTIAVVGGGATGIELATELAEASPRWRVRLVSDRQVGDWLSPAGRAHVRRALARFGVRVDEHTRVQRVTRDRLHTEEGFLDAELTVWAAGMETHPLAAESGLRVARDGRVEVDAYLRSVSHPEVYAVGDAASVRVPGVGTLRMACATAQSMGRYLGSLLAGRTTGPYTFRYVLQCMSLGQRDALVQLVRPDDSTRATVVTGAPARLTKSLLNVGVPHVLR